MSKDKKQDGAITSKPNTSTTQKPFQPKNSELGKIIERGSATGTKKDNSTNSTGPKKTE